jgi:hypothetical protein
MVLPWGRLRELGVEIGVVGPLVEVDAHLVVDLIVLLLLLLQLELQLIQQLLLAFQLLLDLVLLHHQVLPRVPHVGPHAFILDFHHFELVEQTQHFIVIAQVIISYFGILGVRYLGSDYLFVVSGVLPYH